MNDNNELLIQILQTLNNFQLQTAASFTELRSKVEENKKNNIKHTIEEITNALKQGKNILIFPEGARTKDGKVGQFKKVFAILAKELNISVQCIGIKGAFEAYSRYMKFPKPRKIEVKVLEKFSPEGTYEEIAAKAENIIREYVEN